MYIGKPPKRFLSDTSVEDLNCHSAHQSLRIYIKPLFDTHHFWNELNTAAIFWFLANSIRTLEPQGFIHIRDSGKLKPGRHSINYDEFFLSQGFELIKSSSYVNRKEIWGVPRIYQRTSFSSFSPEYTFEYLYDQVLGRYAMTSTGEDLRQGYSPSL